MSGYFENLSRMLDERDKKRERQKEYERQMHDAGYKATMALSNPNLTKEERARYEAIRTMSMGPYGFVD